MTRRTKLEEARKRWGQAQVVLHPNPPTRRARPSWRCTPAPGTSGVAVTFDLRVRRAE